MIYNTLYLRCVTVFNIRLSICGACKTVLTPQNSHSFLRPVLLALKTSHTFLRQAIISVCTVLSEPFLSLTTQPCLIDCRLSPNNFGPHAVIQGFIQYCAGSELQIFCSPPADLLEPVQCDSHYLDWLLTPCHLDRNSFLFQPLTYLWVTYIPPAT